MLGVPVRIHPLFWLMAVVLGWNRFEPQLTIVVWVPCVLFSILVHEFGHALSARRFGSRNPEVTLHALGGLASYASLATRRHRILQILAGPGAGLLVAAIVGIIAWVLPNPHNIWVQRYIDDLLWINLAWSLLNLIPIMPLDGGQAARELFGIRRPQAAFYLAARLSFRIAIVVAAICLVCTIVYIFKDTGTLYQRYHSWLYGLFLSGMLIFVNYQSMRYGSMMQRQEPELPRQSWEKDSDWWR